MNGSIWREIGDPLVEPLAIGPLSGESAAVKDLFAVEGFAVGGGVPQYLDEQPLQIEHATAVRRLLEAGASVRGIARTDQFAYSLDGDNPHYGTPINAAVPGALPGGSSSGSTTAVSLGEATIGLATDTAGSVRVPASYQGLWGLRTTHGAVPVDGLLALSPDFDTVGLLTRTPELLLRAAKALLGQPLRPREFSGTLTWGEAPAELPDLDALYETFRVHQAWQAWQVHGTWITAHPEALLGSVRRRFELASQISSDENSAAELALVEARSELDALLGDALLIMPSAAGPAPRAESDPAALDAIRRATLRLTCLAGITGRPVVSAPLTTTPDGPIGTSYLGPRGSDVALIARAALDAS